MVESGIQVTVPDVVIFMYASQHQKQTGYELHSGGQTLRVSPPQSNCQTQLQSLSLQERPSCHVPTFGFGFGEGGRLGTKSGEKQGAGESSWPLSRRGREGPPPSSGELMRHPFAYTDCPISGCADPHLP